MKSFMYYIEKLFNITADHEKRIKKLEEEKK